MSALNGSDILLYDADTDFPLMCQRSVTVTMNDNMIDATCKQDNGFSVSLAGLRDFSFTADALVNWDEGVADIGITTLYASYNTRVPINIAIANPVIPTGYYIGLAYVESIEINAPMEDVVSYTVSFTGTFEITD
ncbi:MAG: Phage tail tube protein [Bacteroidota bacterium]|jgi:predicted secreted protein